MLEKSKEHLASIEESYWGHMCFALKYGFCCFKAGFAVIIHGICPAVFETTGSDIVHKLNGKVHKDCRNLDGI